MGDLFMGIEVFVELVNQKWWELDTCQRPGAINFPSGQLVNGIVLAAHAVKPRPQSRLCDHCMSMCSDHFTAQDGRTAFDKGRQCSLIDDEMQPQRTFGHHVSKVMENEAGANSFDLVNVVVLTAFRLP